MALARFVRALWVVDPAGGPPQRRGDLQVNWDAPVRTAIDELKGQVDTDAVIAAWEETLSAVEWTKVPRWVHGDLMPANLLVEDGRLTGVIDWEAFGIGDPAVDLAVAWNTLKTDARRVFRRMVQVDDATWTRGRGWALATGLVALPYYIETNPDLAANARFRIAQVLAG
jgi:aminoglycoside phosphotransferase (APT) family kinase protein